MSEDKRLAAFRAGDKQKRRVGAPARAADVEEARTTMGFARIEGILDAAAPGEVGDRLQGLLDALAAREAAATSARERAECKRARGGVERTMDLLAHLYRTKAALEADPAAALGGAGSSP